MEGTSSALSPFPLPFLVLGMTPAQAAPPQCPPNPAFTDNEPKSGETKALLPSANFRVWGFSTAFSACRAAGSSAFSPNVLSSPLECGSPGLCHSVPTFSCFVPSMDPPASFKHGISSKMIFPFCCLRKNHSANPPSLKPSEEMGFNY